MKPSFTLIDCIELAVLLRLQVYSRIFATTIDFQFEIEPVTFVKRCHASTLYGADMYKSIGLTIIALNKAEAFHSIEELDRATRLFSRERSEEHTSELQSLMRISYAVFCLKKKQ